MSALERAIALGYGLAYDAVVERFPPYEALRDEVISLLRRVAPASPGDFSVLDVACGIGNVCLAMHRAGFRVHGVDAVEHLVEIARRKHLAAGAPAGLTFARADLGREPFDGQYDALVSMNTLYWHPAPEAFLTACHGALRPSGHGVFLTYGRPARVLATAAEVRAQRGALAAAHSLRWLVPTALFEALRDHHPLYLDAERFHAMLDAAGFEVLETRSTFLAGICHLAWVRRRDG